MTVDELLAALETLPYGSIVPNPEQRAVMQDSGGPLWVIAGPGTGKTQALILRCLRLLCVDHVAPESIVLTTFTRKAALQLEQRLHETLRLLAGSYPELGSLELSRMHLGTIHSICWELLTASPTSPFRHLHLLDELEQVLFIQTSSRLCSAQAMEDTVMLDLLAWAENPDQPERPKLLPSRWRRTQLFLSLLQRVVEDQVDLDRLAKAHAALALLRTLIGEYEQALAERRFTDYTFIQQHTLTWLTSQEGLAFVRGEAGPAPLQHIIIDEFQDSNPLQAALYRALAANPPHHLCVVGDDDQALYRFRGGTVTCMVRFGDECRRAWPDCRVRQVALTQTYRSHPTIVSWINAYIAHHPALQEPGARVANKAALMAIRTPQAQGPMVWAIGGKTTKEVAEHFALFVKDLLSQGIIVSPSQCALLAHSIKEPTIGPYRAALEAVGIELALPSLPREHPVYQQVVGTLLVALDPHELLLPVNLGEKDFCAFVERCRANCRQDSTLAAVAHQLHTWLTTDSDARYHQPLGRLLEYILNTPSCAIALEQDEAALQAAHWLRRICDAYDRIVEEGRATIPFDAQQQAIQEWWVQRVYFQLAHLLYAGKFSIDEIGAQGVGQHADALLALTVHGAKGLEFPVVAALVDERGCSPDQTHQLERAVVPYRRDLDGSRQDARLFLAGDDRSRVMQDVIRLHYVAYSRARDLLLLLVPESRWKEPPAIGLGGERAWFNQYVREWPSSPKARQRQGRAAASPKGGTLYDLWDA